MEGFAGVHLIYLSGDGEEGGVCNGSMRMSTENKLQLKVVFN